MAMARDAVLVQLFGQRLAPCLVRVNTSTWCQLWSDQVGQQVLLALAADRVHLLRDQFGGGVAAATSISRVVQQAGRPGP
jgi:hypothetical protein